MVDRQAKRAGFSLGRKLSGLAVAGLLLMAVCGCARQSIILVPDPDGRIGKAEVATSAGKQVLEKPGDMTRISGGSESPSAVTTADPAFITATFGEALAIEPPPPQTFTLFFETGSAVPTADSLKIIADIASVIERRSAISISGHTDATGSDRLNDALALERAKQVEALLLQQGVKPALISVTSHGKGNPAIPTPDGVAEPRNRRVVVIVH